MHHAELLSPTMTNKLSKAAGVTRERYLEALATVSECGKLLDDMFRDVDVLDRTQRNRRSAAGLSAIGPTGSLGPPHSSRCGRCCTRRAVSVPVFTGPKGLPMGLQIIAPCKQDERALLWAHWVHRALS